MSHKKSNIKRYYKKSILPSILLFMIFLGVCTGMFVVFVVSFEGYLVESKIEHLYEKTEYLGQLLTTRIKEEGAEKSIASLENYLNEDRDICVTDERGNILWKFGKTVPDFSEAREVAYRENTYIYSDIDPENPQKDKDLHISYNQLLERSFRLLSVDRDQWHEKSIMEGHFWIELPVQIEGYHLYYKDFVTMEMKSSIYIIGAIFVDTTLLLLLIILLLINVLSSIITQRRMVHLLYLDTVTEGKNWLYFIQRSRRILCQIRNTGNTYAMVNLHMNHYQDYCACYGSKDGEELLKKLNAFLRVAIEKNEVFARSAMADFGLLLRCGSEEQCEKRLRKLLADLTGIQPERALTYQAGLCMIPAVKWKNTQEHPRKQMDMEQIYHYANVARESLGRNDGGFIKVFDAKILQEQVWKHKVEDMMESALLNKEFQLYLQPKYNPVTQKIVSAEALVRWISPTEGMISPGRFIPIFEESGFITKLDEYMISAVARLQSEWKIQGKKLIPVSVNVSRAHFAKDNLARHICRLVDGYGAEHDLIELEVTESAFFGDKDTLQRILRELKGYDFRISMDDFGAGYSSLNSLKDLPIDILKLDMEFFRGDDKENRGRIVVQEIIRLAKKLHMLTVAEGIEKKEQVEFLAEQGCDMIQGFYFARPMPVAEFEELLRIEEQV